MAKPVFFQQFKETKNRLPPLPPFHIICSFSMNYLFYIRKFEFSRKKFIIIFVCFICTPNFGNVSAIAKIFGQRALLNCKYSMKVLTMEKIKISGQRTYNLVNLPILSQPIRGLAISEPYQRNTHHWIKCYQDCKCSCVQQSLYRFHVNSSIICEK